MTLARIDRALLDAVSAAAKASPRGRRNHNFHPTADFPAHRLLNAIEPGSYVMPHRHLDRAKDETIIVLRGRLGVVVFDAAGAVVDTVALAAGGEVCGIDIPHGTWHTVLALESGTVMFEAKAGPFLALAEAERAPWAPAENAPDAAACLDRLRALFAGG